MASTPLAGAIWSVHRIGDGRVARLLRVLLSEGNKLGVVLWWEGIDKPRVSPIRAEVQRLLRWMNPRVMVTSRQLFGEREQEILQGLQVSSLEGAPAR